MNKPTDSIVLLVVPSYAHDERISRQVHHYLSNTNPAKGSPLFGSIMLGQACYWLTGICFSERLHADSTASFISFQLCPERTREMCEDCQGLKRTHFFASASNLIILPKQQQQFHALKVQPPSYFPICIFSSTMKPNVFFFSLEFPSGLVTWLTWESCARASVKLSEWQQYRQQQTIKNLMDAGLHVSCWKCTCFVWLCGCLLLIPECAKDCAHVSNSCSMRLMAGGIGWPSAADTWCVFVDNCLAGLNFKKSTCKIPQVTVLVFVVRHQVKV